MGSQRPQAAARGGQHLGGGEPDLDVVLSHFQQTDMFGVVHVDGSFIIGIDPVLQSAPVLSGKFRTRESQAQSQVIMVRKAGGKCLAVHYPAAPSFKKFWVIMALITL